MFLSGSYTGEDWEIEHKETCERSGFGAEGAALNDMILKKIDTPEEAERRKEWDERQKEKGA